MHSRVPHTNLWCQVILYIDQIDLFTLHQLHFQVKYQVVVAGDADVSRGLQDRIHPHHGISFDDFPNFLQEK